MFRNNQIKIEIWLLLAILGAVLGGPVGAGIVAGLWGFDFITAIIRSRFF